MADVDGIADVLRSIEGVQVAALLRETDRNTYRVSLRSGERINVARVAQSFGGGGHHNAAGCTFKATKKEKDKLISALCKMVV